MNTTAQAWSKPSRVARVLVQEKFITNSDKVLDWGCGFGRDISLYKTLNNSNDGFDPIHYNNKTHLKFLGLGYNVVVCNCVLNTVVFAERIKILKDIYEFLPYNGKAFFSTREFVELKHYITKDWVQYEDGYITTHGTFQAIYTTESFLDLISSVFPQSFILKNWLGLVQATK